MSHNGKNDPAEAIYRARRRVSGEALSSFRPACRTDFPEGQTPLLWIHLLNRCNLLCRHCYVEASPRGTLELPSELVLRTLRDAQALGISSLLLSGGEPFLYRDLPRILEAASELFDGDLCVSTNGTLIHHKEAETLRRCGFRAQVSLDGEESYHDVFRGVEGSFRRTSAGVDNLVSAGVPVSVVTTVCRENLASLPRLAEWAWAAGARRLSVQPLLALGRGAEIHSSRLSREELCDLFFQMSDLGHSYRTRGLELSLAHRTRRFLLAHPCAAYVCNGSRCHRGVEREIKKIVVREDGQVLPEIPTLDCKFALGNLHCEGLSEMVPRYLANGYEKFHDLCRLTFAEVMPKWSSPLVPWDEIVTARSHRPAATVKLSPAAGAREQAERHAAHACEPVQR